MDVYEEAVEEVASDVELPVAVYDDKFISDDVLEDEAAAASVTTSAHSKQNQQHGQSRRVPDVISNFISYFYRTFNEGNVPELFNLYENGFNRLSEKFYSKGTWPTADSIGHLFNQDPFFTLLYKDLYYRHLYTHLQPTLEQRVASYNNYIALFQSLLTEQHLDVELPNQWLWDIIDEFLYQFESFSRFRAKLKSANDLESLAKDPLVWNAEKVIDILNKLVELSKINEQLIAAKQGLDPNSVGGAFGGKSLYKMLGYFSIIGLARVHCSLGDFHGALKVMEHFELNRRGLFARVTACHVTTFYYVAFAYMMMRRYSDAIKTLTHILLFIARTKQYHTRSYQYEQIVKKSTQMYALLAISVTLCPQRIDEQIHTTLREKYGDSMNRMQRGEEGLAVFEDLFQFAAPKFFSPSMEADASNEPLKHITRLFMNDVKEQLVIPVIRSYLKLYSTLQLEKLATFLETDKENALRQLLSYKNKSQQLRWKEGPLLSGEMGGSVDLDFTVKDEVIYVVESKVARRYGDYFIRNIGKLNEVIKHLKSKNN